jgi:histone deacetylase complex regulatory component SIN3
LVLSPQLKKLVALLQHEVQRLRQMPPKLHFIQLTKAEEMKLQILDEGLDSNREGKTISFFNELDTETRTMLVTSVSFFNEVATEMQKTILKWFHFLMSLKLENHAQRPLFHFLTRLLQRRKNYPRKWFHF